MSGGEEAVQATNDDATSCKISAVSLGYWRDNYIQFMTRLENICEFQKIFVSICRQHRCERRAPEIHLGYYARVAGVHALIEKFFEACDTAVQVISLGAGFDTLFWRLVADGRPVNNFIEIDFAAVTARKCMLIKRSKELMQACSK